MMDDAMRSDWIKVEVGILAELFRGISYKKHQASNTPADGYRPVLRANNISGTLIFNDLLFVPESLIKPEQIVKKGDIIFAMSSGSRRLVGKSAQAKMDFDGSYGAFCALLRPSNGLNKQYLSFFFHSNYFRKLISEVAKGTNINNLKREHIINSIIPLAPLPEQDAIVAKTEQLFSKLDYGIASLKAAKKKLALYRQSVLNKAFEGELTREWRGQQTKLPDTDELLKQIKTELGHYHKQQLQDWQVAVKAWTATGKERKKKPAKPKKYRVITELTKEDLSGLPELPNEWCWQKLGSICQKIQIGPFGSQMHKHEYVEEGVPVVNPQHIKSQKIFPQIFISEEKAKSLPQYVLEENDIILGRRGEMGRSACISAKEQGWFCGSGSLFIRLGNRFNGILYSLILSEGRVVHYLEEKGSGTTMTNLNSTILSELPVQLIPLKEQAQITTEIESRFSVCDHLQQEIERGLQKAEALRQSILKKAFEGRLLTEAELADCRAVPDWEPAQQLLERIQVEKRAKHKTESHPYQ